MGRLAPPISSKAALILSIFLLLLSSCVPPNKTELPNPFPITVIKPIKINNKKGNGSELEKLKQKVESFPKSLADAKSGIYLTFINALAVGVGIATFVLVAISIASWAYFRRLVFDNVKVTVRREISKSWQEQLETLQTYYRERSDMLASDIYAILGFEAWEHDRVDEAIAKTEYALSFNPAGAIRGRIINNLAYYLARRGREEDRENAISLSAEAVNLFRTRYPDRTAWLSTDIFVRIKYAQSLEELNGVVVEANRIKHLYPELESEMDEYLDFAREREEELR